MRLRDQAQIDLKYTFADAAEIGGLLPTADPFGIVIAQQGQVKHFGRGQSAPAGRRPLRLAGTPQIADELDADALHDLMIGLGERGKTAGAKEMAVFHLPAVLRCITAKIPKI